MIDKPSEYIAACDHSFPAHSRPAGTLQARSYLLPAARLPIGANRIMTTEERLQDLERRVEELETFKATILKKEARTVVAAERILQHRERRLKAIRTAANADRSA